jgi:hypothetical protein
VDVHPAADRVDDLHIRPSFAWGPARCLPPKR